MPNKPLADKMTKPELVKALKAAQKRIAKLEARLVFYESPSFNPDNIETAEVEIKPPAEQRGFKIVSQRSAAEVIESVLPGSMFPWEKK